MEAVTVIILNLIVVHLKLHYLILCCSSYTWMKRSIDLFRSVLKRNWCVLCSDELSWKTPLTLSHRCWPTRFFSLFLLIHDTPFRAEKILTECFVEIIENGIVKTVGVYLRENALFVWYVLTHTCILFTCEISSHATINFSSTAFKRGVNSLRWNVV